MKLDWFNVFMARIGSSSRGMVHLCGKCPNWCDEWTYLHIYIFYGLYRFINLSMFIYSEKASHVNKGKGLKVSFSALVDFQLEKVTYEFILIGQFQTLIGEIENNTQVIIFWVVIYVIFYVVCSFRQTSTISNILTLEILII